MIETLTQITHKLPRILLDFILFPFGNIWFSIVRGVFIIASLAILVFIIFALLKTDWLKVYLGEDAAELLTFKPSGIRRIEKDWQKILARLNTAMDSEYKLAVIEADGLMDETLKRMGYKGSSLGKRLDNLTEASIPNIVEVREAHKIRNNIVHDPNYQLTIEETKKALSFFEKAFRELDAF